MLNNIPAETISVSDGIIKTLGLCTADKNEIFLPDRQLCEIPVSEFKSLQNFLKRYKSRWQSKFQSFKFDFNTEAFMNLVLTHKVAPKPNPLAYHPTPKSVIELMLLMAGLDKGMKFHKARILEPSGGGGAILSILKGYLDDSSSLDTCELDYFNRQSLTAQGFNLKNDNFLEYTPNTKYDYIFMNPPFSKKGDPTSYITHVLHAYKMLEPCGRLVAVVPISFLSGEDCKTKEFREFCALDVEFEMERVEGGTFTSTSIETCVISLRGELSAKPSNSADIFYYRADLTLCNDFNFYQKLCKMKAPCSSVYIEELALELRELNLEELAMPVKYLTEYMKAINDKLNEIGISVLPELAGDQFTLFGTAA